MDGSAGNMSSYLYHPDSIGADDIPWIDVSNSWLQVFPGRWYQFESRIKLNTPGNHDGCHEVWVDNIKVLSVTNLRFRDINSLKIDKLYFSTFHGGNGLSYAPNSTGYIYYDDIVVSKSRIGAQYDDSDDDGLRDAWELMNFNSLNSSDGTIDSDGDGSSDGEEYHSGSDPNNSCSVFTIEIDSQGVYWSSLYQHQYLSLIHI